MITMSPPRLAPEFAWPPYTFVPGRTPHPVRDPAGHLFGKPCELPPPLEPSRWQEGRDYLHGVDLFNHGYYWEAHEVWEGLWRAAGRVGPTADFLKGLIKLAAAGVKVRQGQSRGVVSHAAGAAAHFRTLADERGGEDTSYLGLRLGDLLAFAHRVERQASAVRTEEDDGVKVVFDFQLLPAPLSSGNAPPDATI
jgi:predicted metal-dependent hydrolase